MAEMRGNMGETLRNLLLWGAIITVVAIGYGYKTQARVLNRRGFRISGRYRRQ